MAFELSRENCTVLDIFAKLRETNANSATRFSLNETYRNYDQLVAKFFRRKMFH